MDEKERLLAYKRAMNDRQRKTKDPCPNCSLHRDLCICEHMHPLELKTRLCLIIHHRELKRTTNTGRLALKMLSNSEMKVRGELGHDLDLSDLLKSSFRTFLLYPCDEAVDLTRELVEADSRPIQLLVPDGNWRQASKVHYRHSELRDVVRVKTVPRKDFSGVLRTESKTDGMATLQAIAEAFGVIEGEAVRDKLLEIYQLKLDRTLKARGHKINPSKQSDL